MTFAQILINLMQKKNITAYRMSVESGFSQSLISDWKTGPKLPSAENLVKLADYFNVTTDYLLGRTGFLLELTDNPTPAGTEDPYASPEEHDLLAKIRALPPEKRKAIETLIN